jgi:hypothetical protein
MPHKVWQVGEEVLAADFNTYVQNQAVIQFPNVAARDTWASPPDGAVCVTLDNGVVWQRNAGVWKTANAASSPRILTLVRTNVAITPFVIPTDAITRLYLVAWSWWSWGNSANGTMSITLKIQGGANIGVYNIPFAASAAPVPTLSSVSYFQFTQNAGVAAVTLEAVLNGGTAGWQADGYVNAIGYPA